MDRDRRPECRATANPETAQRRSTRLRPGNLGGSWLCSGATAALNVGRLIVDRADSLLNPKENP